MVTGEIIRLDRTSTVYDGERTPAIRDIDLTVDAGDFVCVVGPNGAGKTTLLESINGVLRPTAGSVKVFGLDLLERGIDIRKRIGYVIQNFEIDPLSPFLCRNVVMSGRVGRIGLLRFPSSKDWSAVTNALERVGMASYADRPVGKLSGGEFQKILLARAIAQEPDVFLLDEPFANLDLKSRREVDRLIADLNRDGATILMVSHEVDAIPASCTHIVVMDRGRIAEHGTRDEVLASKVIERLMVGRSVTV